MSSHSWSILYKLEALNFSLFSFRRNPWPHKVTSCTKVIFVCLWLPLLCAVVTCSEAKRVSTQMLSKVHSRYCPERQAALNHCSAHAGSALNFRKLTRSPGERALSAFHKADRSMPVERGKLMSRGLPERSGCPFHELPLARSLQFRDL